MSRFDHRLFVYVSLEMPHRKQLAISGHIANDKVEEVQRETA